MGNTLKVKQFAKTPDQILSEVSELSGTDVFIPYNLGLIPIDVAIKWIVQKKYWRMAKSGMTYSAIKVELSEEYSLSVSSIEKLVYKK